MSSRQAAHGGGPEARSGGEQPPGQTRLPGPRAPAPALALAQPAATPQAGRVVGNAADHVVPAVTGAVQLSFLPFLEAGGQAPAAVVQRSPAPAPPSTADATLAALVAALPGVAIRVRRSRRTLLSLRQGRDGSLGLGIDPRLLIKAEWSVPIVEWVRRGGRGGAGAGLRAALADAQRDGLERRVASIAPELAALPTVGPAVNLETVVLGVHARWFADLSLPAVGWARDAHRRLSAIRFGCYRRGPPARISIHPRLGRPWVARAFLEHVVFHELCHHRQACEPQRRREGMHSPRFRAWERAFPDHAAALAWERAVLPCLLDDAAPPWYGRPSPGAPP